MQLQTVKGKDIRYGGRRVTKDEKRASLQAISGLDICLAQGLVSVSTVNVYIGWALEGTEVLVGKLGFFSGHPTKHTQQHNTVQHNTQQYNILKQQDCGPLLLFSDKTLGLP